MRRLRLKADGRIVEVSAAGGETPLAQQPAMTLHAAPMLASEAATRIKAMRARSQLTQTQLACRLGVPVETIRNWEQGKRLPRGPARALLRLIENAPEAAFAMLEEHIA